MQSMDERNVSEEESFLNLLTFEREYKDSKLLKSEM